MYTMADQSWQLQPTRMSYSVMDQAAARIGEHVRAHQLRAIKVVLHGGEPLLAGPGLIRHSVRSIREAVGRETRADIVVQTNGLALDATYLDLFAGLRLRVGISIDGNSEAHDRHRRRANGQGSYEAVRAALRRLTAHPKGRDLFGGLLCTIDVRNDPVTTYEALLEFAPPMVDLLLPHGNWATPPPHRTAGSAETPYGDWLIAVFDRWYGARQRETRVRLFAEIMHALLGGASGTEAVGLSPTAMAVVETDGGIEQCDSLKSAFAGAPATGLHVARDSFDAALTHPAIAARQLGVAALCAGCQSCPILRVCGGGHFVHRYRPGSGFLNPSVYCPDLLKLITHVWRVMEADISALAERRG